MNEAVTRIIQLEHRVLWRKRLLTLQDLFVLAMMISALIGGVFVVITRLGSITIPLWTVIAAMSLAFLGALLRWFKTRAEERDASFLIDESLKLDDRVATSRLIIKRGGPTGALEEALIEDAAARLSDQRASSIVPYRTRRWYALLPLSAIALAIAFLIPERLLPVDQALAAERADIQIAGEILEETAVATEQSAPPGTETAKFAKEQAEIGRGFRRALATRSEALRRLSALEERIRRRRGDLESTRAGEIVNLADRRMGSALSTLSSARRPAVEQVEGKLAAKSYEQQETLKQGGANETPVTSTDGSKPPLNRAATGSKPDAVGEPTPAAKKQETADPTDPAAVDAKGDGAETSKKDVGDAQPPPAASAELLKAVPDSLAEQAAKALPKISEELLKKAAELRANELSPRDIEKLRRVAESLAGDLTQIAESKELQKALQEMARQTRPEQIEQVARELGKQEKLKQELEAASRLLSENRQAKDMVAGLAGEFARTRGQNRQQDNNPNDDGKPEITDAGNRGMDRASSGNRANAGGRAEQIETVDRSKGRGRETSLKGKLQQRSGGEYLYLQSKAGAGAARAPYSSVYPQYRREAERSVQRSKVPANLRTVVRKYFDAINPDAKRP